MILVNAPHFGGEIAAIIGMRFSPGDVCIANVENNHLLGGVIFREYTEESIQAHVGAYSPNWLNRDMLWVMFHYPFVQLKCNKIFGTVRATNTRALEFDLKLGFKEETRIKNVFPDGDLIVLAMEQKDCRWLGIKPKTICWQENT